MWTILFPGQGSQHVGMARFLFDNFTSTKHRFEQASDLLKTNFKKLLFEGPESELQLTQNTQPALLLASSVLVDVLKEETAFPFKYAAGHSLGEYSALVAAGVLTFEDALRSVRKRGELMQTAVPVGQGAMVAVLGPTDEEVQRLCQWAVEETGEVVEPANFNAPGQVVVSGSKKGIDFLVSQYSPEKLGWDVKRLKFIPLSVSAPFHCSLMSPAEEAMTPVLEGIAFKKAHIPIVQNVTAEPTVDPLILRKNLIRQISSPVLWSQSVNKLSQMGVTKTLEAGPGKVLSGLSKKIDRNLATFNIQSLEELRVLEAELEKGE